MPNLSTTTTLLWHLLRTDILYNTTWYRMAAKKKTSIIISLFLVETILFYMITLYFLFVLYCLFWIFILCCWCQIIFSYSLNMDWNNNWKKWIKLYNMCKPYGYAINLLSFLIFFFKDCSLSYVIKSVSHNLLPSWK